MLLLLCLRIIHTFFTDILSKSRGLVFPFSVCRMYAHLSEFFAASDNTMKNMCVPNLLNPNIGRPGNARMNVLEGGS